MYHNKTETAKNDINNSHLQSIGKLPFIFFLIWTFFLIGRPQDYIQILSLIKPVALITFVTLALIVFSGIKLQKGFGSLPEVRLLLSFMIIMIIGIPFAVHKRVAFDFVFTIFPRMLLYFFSFLYLVNSTRRLKSTAWAGVLGAIFSAAIYFKNTILSGNLGQRVYASQMYDPNDIAFIFVSFLPLTIYFFLTQRSLIKKVALLLSALFMATGIIITQSRGGMLALGIIFLALLSLRTKLWRGWRKLFIVLVFIGLFIYYLPIAIDRFDNIGSDYNVTEEGGRIHIWKQNLEIFLNNPIFGVGANCSAIALGFYRAEHNEGLQAWQVTHSSIIQVAVETGLPGLLIYIVLNLRALFNFRRMRKQLNPELSLFVFLIETCFYGFWTSALFLTHGYSIILFFLLGMSASLRLLMINQKLAISD